jgi:hypothetical protein
MTAKLLETTPFPAADLAFKHSPVAYDKRALFVGAT